MKYQHQEGRKEKNKKISFSLRPLRLSPHSALMKFGLHKIGTCHNEA